VTRSAWLTAPNGRRFNGILWHPSIHREPRLLSPSRTHVGPRTIRPGPHSARAATPSRGIPILKIRAEVRSLVSSARAPSMSGGAPGLTFAGMVSGATNTGGRGMYHRAPWVEFPIRRNPVFRAARTSLLPREWCLESRRRGSHAPPREGGGGGDRRTPQWCRRSQSWTPFLGRPVRSEGRSPVRCRGPSLESGPPYFPVPTTTTTGAEDGEAELSSPRDCVSRDCVSRCNPCQGPGEASRITRIEVEDSRRILAASFEQHSLRYLNP
jgi:hypothetical protein